MPKADPYYWTTDEVVLARLKKSPVRCDYTDATSRFTVEDGHVVRQRLGKNGAWASYIGAVFPSDAHHIAMAWMVELAQKCYEVSGYSPQLWWDEAGGVVVTVFDEDHLGEDFESQYLIEALAHARSWYDWLEGEKP